MMVEITVLDSSTIDKIAAGEVVERPASVVKELIENAIDAGATAITVEIKEGGISLIRITDNGMGIEKNQIRKAFMRHATSKIKTVEDLTGVTSLGFRGEALSSIAAVSRVEMMTKTEDNFIGIRYVVEGAIEKEYTEVGVPTGTTILIHNLFYNTPPRRKFLKSPGTEGSYISDLCERLALGKPHISFKFINNGKLRFQTTGNGDMKEVIYRIFGREVSKELIFIDKSTTGMRIQGYLGKPTLNRANRNFENYFVNGRYVKSGILAKSIEEGYRNYLMQHKFPFLVLYFEMEGTLLDVNVHPTKMDIRFSNQNFYQEFISKAIGESLKETELIPQVSFDTQKPVVKEQNQPLEKAEPFEVKRKSQEVNRSYTQTSNSSFAENKIEPLKKIVEAIAVTEESTYQIEEPFPDYIIKKAEQINFFEEKILTPENVVNYEIIGQIFHTYWLIEFEGKLLFVDQHAAHEKVKYEALIKKLENNMVESQIIEPPIVFTLSSKEALVLQEQSIYLNKLGFFYEDFGSNAIVLRQVPLDLFGSNGKQLFQDILDELMELNLKMNPTVILEKIASMSCKAAVKGNHRMNEMEMKTLLDQLLQLENPYHCPHGRPTMISMSKSEIEKKFKRII